jgi:hypothetical protein
LFDNLKDWTRLSHAKGFLTRQAGILRFLVLTAVVSSFALAADPVRPEGETEAVMAATRTRLRQMLGTDEIVFIKLFTYNSNHYYTEFLNSQWKPGGGIYILSLTDGSTRQLATELKGGVFGRFDISFDARKVVFDWKRSNDEGYRIYEVGIDGSGLRQILKAPDNEAELVKKYHLDYGRRNLQDKDHPDFRPVPTWESALGIPPLPDDPQ